MHNLNDISDLVTRSLDEGTIKRKDLEDPYPGRVPPLSNGILAGEGVLEARAAYQENRPRLAKEKIAPKAKTSEASHPAPVHAPGKVEPSAREKVTVVAPRAVKLDEANDLIAQSFTTPAAMDFSLGEIVAPSAPRQRLFEIRYFLERPFFAIPHKGPIELAPYKSPNRQLFIRTKALNEALGVATIDDAEILMVIGTELYGLMLEDPSCREVALQPCHVLRWIHRKTGGNQ